jgi:hypothetical protein
MSGRYLIYTCQDQVAEYGGRIQHTLLSESHQTSIIDSEKNTIIAQDGLIIIDAMMKVSERVSVDDTSHIGDNDYRWKEM